MIAIPYKKDMMKEKSQVRIFKKEAFKLHIFGSLMGILTHLMCFQKFFLSSPIQRRNIKDLISL
jgi:hypothetical protein